MALKLKNNAVGLLNSTFNIGATSFTVAAGQGALFPTLGVGDWTYVTLEDGSGNIEIVKVTIIAGDTMGGITRAIDGTTERNWSPSNVVVEGRLCMSVLNDYAQVGSNQTWAGNQTFNGDVSVAAFTKAEPKTDNTQSLGSATKRWLNAFISGVLRWGSGSNTVSLSAEVSTTGAKTVVVPATSGTLALLDSPEFTGTPKAPTPATDDNSTKIATTAFVAASTGSIGKKSVWVPATDMYGGSGTTGVTWADFTTSGNTAPYRVYHMPDVAVTEASFALSLPKAWNRGPITYRLYFDQAGVASGNVEWLIDASSSGNNEFLALAANYLTFITPVPAIGNLVVSAETPQHTVAGAPQDHDLLHFKITRNGPSVNDTLAKNVRLYGVMIYYTADRGNDA